MGARWVAAYLDVESQRLSLRHIGGADVSVPVAYQPGVWYHLELVRVPGSVTATLTDEAGQVVGTVSASFPPQSTALMTVHRVWVWGWVGDGPASAHHVDNVALRMG